MPERAEDAPVWFPVTDPYLDAPDGARLWFEEHMAAYVRVGDEWCRDDG